MELFRYDSEKPISMVRNDDAFNFFMGLWDFVLGNDVIEVLFGTHGKLVSNFNYFQSKKTTPEHQRIATTFLSTYLIAEKDSLGKIANAFEGVADDLSGGKRDVSSYITLAKLLREGDESLVFANQNANHSKFYRDGKLLSLNSIASQIPSATKLPVYFACKNGHSDFY